MRLTTEQRKRILETTRRIAGADAVVLLFGSRLDDRQRGGDVDLLVELPHEVDDPAWLAARLSAALSRALQGRKVDVLLTAPNLAVSTVHRHALETGVVL